MKIPSLLILLTVAASGGPFQVGDVFVSGRDGNGYRFSPSGTLLQVIPGAGGYGMAFDNSGNLYVAEGSAVRKFDNSGNPIGNFATGFPGIFGSATDISFDPAGNAYVVGIQDGSNDFIRKFTSGGAVLGTQSFVQGQENWVYDNYAGNNLLLVTPGTTVLVDRFDSNTLASSGPSIGIAGGGPNGDIVALPGGGFLVITGDPVAQYDGSGHQVMTYNSLTSGTFIGVDLAATPSSFWAVTDFGEVRKFNLGSGTAVTSFSAGIGARGLAVYTVPEPSTWILACAVFVLPMLSRRRASSR